MDQKPTTSRACPACKSTNYQFRHRKTIAPEPGTEGGEAVETKYRCKDCTHEWRERVPVKP